MRNIGTKKKENENLAWKNCLKKLLFDNGLKKCEIAKENSNLLFNENLSNLIQLLFEKNFFVSIHLQINLLNNELNENEV